jgi:hypothetical protein
VFIDDSVILACTLAEALSCLRDADAIASWFDARRGPTHTTLRASGRQLVLARRHVDWRPENGVLLIEAIAGAVRINTHLTLRSVIRIATAQRLRQGTEIWVHVDLAPTPEAHPIAAVIRTTVRRGLEQLRLELDAAIDEGP